MAETVVKEISNDELDSILSEMPDGDFAITQEVKQEKSKNNIFSNPNEVDLTFLDKKEESSEEKINDINGTSDLAIEDHTEKEEVVDVDSILDGKEENTEDQVQNKKDLISFFKKQVENKKMRLYDDYDENQSIEEYLGKMNEEELEGLYDDNINSIRSEIENQTPVEFFESLPQELQYAAKYVADGGKDLKSLFNTLARVEETKNLDISTSKGQEQAIREYLSSTNFGTQEEIQAQIEEWSDLGKLEEKSTMFKPKLDKMQESIIERKLKEQEATKLSQIEAQRKYSENLYKTLNSTELNGIKINPDIQNKLFKGLTEASYVSVKGNNTNLFGHLIEKHQFGKQPRLDLIAEATWLLADPDGYRESIKQIGKNAQAEKTLKELKTEQSGSKNNAQTITEVKGKGSLKIPAPNKNFFKF